MNSSNVKLHGEHSGDYSHGLCFLTIERVLVSLVHIKIEVPVEKFLLFQMFIMILVGLLYLKRAICGTVLLGFFILSLNYCMLRCGKKKSDTDYEST